MKYCCRALILWTSYTREENKKVGSGNLMERDFTFSVDDKYSKTLDEDELLDLAEFKVKHYLSYLDKLDYDLTISGHFELYTCQDLKKIKYVSCVTDIDF